jgi:hypothetical protein
LLIAAVFIYVVLGIVNVDVSIKYEIEPFDLKTADPAILEKAGLYHDLINTFWVVICLCILSGILLLDKIIKTPWQRADKE